MMGASAVQHASEVANAESAGRKRKGQNRLGRTRGKQAKVDRLNMLFEAIEADKASDSENASANYASSAGNQGQGEDEVQEQNTVSKGGSEGQDEEEEQVVWRQHKGAVNADDASAMQHEAQQPSAGFIGDPTCLTSADGSTVQQTTFYCGLGTDSAVLSDVDMAASGTLDTDQPSEPVNCPPIEQDLQLMLPYAL